MGWRDAPWWSRLQVDNIDAILDSVKRTYNVDENRVVLSGVSDGATGLYYVAMRDSTPFASFLPLNGFMMVLANDQLAVDAEMFPTNLLNKPFFIVNGGQDPLYPIRNVQPFVDHLRESGVQVEYSSAARGRAQHGLVAGDEGRLRDLRANASARSAVRPAHVGGDGARRPQPHRLAGHRSRAAADRGRHRAMKPDLNLFSGAGPEPRARSCSRTRAPSGRVDLDPPREQRGDDHERRGSS